MFWLNLTVITVMYFVVTASTFHGEEPSKHSHWKEANTQEDFPPELTTNSNSPSQKIMVLKMHYDCQGKLLRQEASNLSFITGLILIPEEEQIFTNMYKRLQPLPMAPGDESNDVDRIYNGITEAPSYFKSMPNRFKTRPTLKPLSDKTSIETTPPPFREAIRPPAEKGPAVKIDPDRIIDVPRLPCPPGEKEDMWGDCRPPSWK